MVVIAMEVEMLVGETMETVIDVDMLQKLMRSLKEKAFMFDQEMKGVV